MKKSEMFKVAQLSVIRDSRLSDSDKLEIIRLLADEEYTATIIEKRKEEEAEQNAEN